MLIFNLEMLILQKNYRIIIKFKIMKREVSKEI
jgi:hypothetical protein